MARTGRPRQTEEQACAKAVRVIEVALALHNRRLGKLSAMGLSERQACKLVTRRHRGRVGELIGDSLICLTPPINRTAAAVRMVLEHGAKIRWAAMLYNLDLRSLRRAVLDSRPNFLPQNTPSHKPT